MKATPGTDTFAAATPDPVIEEVRARFVADFPLRCDAAARLLVQARADDTRREATSSLRALAHRVAGLAGVIGFRRVSAIASDLEAVIVRGEGAALDADTAEALVTSLRTAFTEEIAGPVRIGPDRRKSVSAGTVVIAEDDDEQRTIVTKYLQDAGYRVEGVAAGSRVVETVRSERPSVVLLDVEMPELDGYSVCRELKADPALAAIPVLFLTTRARLDDRLAGLTLGADDYLAKPVDLAELLLRLEHVSDRFTARAQEANVSNVLSYEEFAQVCRKRLRLLPGSLVLIRVPPQQLRQAAAHVTGDIRRTDLAGHYDHSHLLLYLPGVSGHVASARATEILGGLAGQGIGNVVAGVASSETRGTKAVETLLAEADDALMQARHFGKPAMVHGALIDEDSAPSRGLVLIADDDPDVMRIVDAQMRGAGYRTSLAFDGKEALAAVESSRPDILILDLMMPKIGGFDVLARLQQAGDRRPKSIVLSARGREDDVTRAFELGADDYVTKPFNPQELLARVARLSR